MDGRSNWAAPLFWETIVDKEREEYLRLERVAVGRICRCGKCLCCKEYVKHYAKRITMYRETK